MEPVMAAKAPTIKTLNLLLLTNDESNTMHPGHLTLQPLLRVDG